MITMPKRFGMFIHWGPYAIPAWHEQIRMRQGIGRAEYAAMAADFAPEKYDPEAWVKLAKEAGMEYICFTAKHHDGFCMWNTAETDFNIMKTGGRDVLAELAEACRKHDMALSLYYSIPDWNHPCGYNELSTHQCMPEPGDTPDSEAYRAYVRAQVKELLTGYGPIYTWFWDIPPKIDDPSMNDYVRSLQPGILINDRGWSEGDFSTPERSVPDGDTFPRYTEACQSVGQYSWGYREAEEYFTPAFLARSIDKIFLMGGSYLLNVGPDRDGVIPEPAAEIVRTVGRWYLSVREAFACGAEPESEWKCSAVWAARAGERLYLHTKAPLISTGLSLAPLDTMPESAVLLNTGEPVECVLETYPEDYTGTFGVNRPPVLRLRNLPAADNGMPLVIRLLY
ncbi:MAG: glycoside hydrolase [Ruminococcaceae bacterium]|nr:glycoside hydrolase [Oscillospiraceae bacterium]